VRGHTDRVDVTVWVDEWQFDCCGEPFGVGSVVSWRIGPTSDFLADMLGPGAGVTIDAFEDHHIGLPAGTPPTRGTVLAIHGAYQRYAHRGKGDPTRYPVSGSGVLVPLARAKRFQEDRDDLTFMGYVVRLSVPGPWPVPKAKRRSGPGT
jgi:hypothetical protein